MKSYLFYLPVWLISFGALGVGVAHGGGLAGTLYVGLGVLGVSTINALMFQHRRIAELERRLAARAG